MAHIRDLMFLTVFIFGLTSCQEFPALDRPDYASKLGKEFGNWGNTSVGSSQVFKPVGKRSGSGPWQRTAESRSNEGDNLHFKHKFFSVLLDSQLAEISSAAKYNKNITSSIPSTDPVQVYVKFADEQDLTRLVYKANQANKIYPGTISTFYLISNDVVKLNGLITHLTLNSNSPLPFKYNYTVGIEVYFEKCSEDFLTEISRYPKLSNITFNILWDWQNNIIGVERHFAEVKTAITTCKRIFNSTSISISFLLTWSDRNIYGQMNQTALVWFWRSFSNWAKEEETVIFMDQLIDSNDSLDVLEKQNGWFDGGFKEKYLSPIDYDAKPILRENCKNTTEKFPKTSTKEDLNSEYIPWMHSSLDRLSDDQNIKFMETLYNEYSEILVVFSPPRRHPNHLDVGFYNLLSYAMVQSPCQAVGGIGPNITPIVFLTKEAQSTFVEINQRLAENINYTTMRSNAYFPRILFRYDRDVFDVLDNIHSLTKLLNEGKSFYKDLIQTGIIEDIRSLNQYVEPFIQWLSAFYGTENLYLMFVACDASDFLEFGAVNIAKRAFTAYMSIIRSIEDTLGDTAQTIPKPGFIINIDKCLERPGFDPQLTILKSLIRQQSNSENISVVFDAAMLHSSTDNFNLPTYMALDKGANETLEGFDDPVFSTTYGNMDVIMDESNKLCGLDMTHNLFRNSSNILVKQVPPKVSFNKMLFGVFLGTLINGFPLVKGSSVMEELPYVRVVGSRFSNIVLSLDSRERHSFDGAQLSTISAIQILNNLRRNCSAETMEQAEVTLITSLIDLENDTIGLGFKQNIKVIRHAHRILSESLKLVLFSMLSSESDQIRATSFNKIEAIYLEMSKSVLVKFGIICNATSLPSRALTQGSNLFDRPYIDIVYIRYQPCVDDFLTDDLGKASELIIKAHRILLDQFQRKYRSDAANITKIGIFTDMTSCSRYAYHIEAAKFWVSLNVFSVQNNVPVIVGPAFSEPNAGFGEWWRVSRNDSGTVIEEHEVPQSALPEVLTPWFYWAIPFVIVLNVFALFLVKSFLSHRKRYANIREEAKLFIEGEDASGNKVATNNLINSFTTNIIFVPYDRSFEIPSSNFELESNQMLGSGCYGKVTLAKMKANGNTMLAAVKYVNGGYTNQIVSFRSILMEIKVLMHIGSHENIVQFLGANTKGINQGKVYIFLDFCERGSLKQYLKECRKSHAHDTQVSTEVLSDDTLKLDFLKWTKDIAAGMEFISSKFVVHADLATRNVLLDKFKVAKICDFGLSRRMDNYENYVKTNQEPLPWQWMAYESLRDREFSTKSDVWSYGVTLWEIFSKGEMPFSGTSWTVDFVEQIKDGMRLWKPRFASDELYNIMMSCWMLAPERRPDFSQILETLNTIPKSWSDNTTSASGELRTRQEGKSLDSEHPAMSSTLIGPSASGEYLTLIE